MKLQFRRNSISCLKQTDGTDVIDHAGKEKVIFEAFKERLGTRHNPDMLFKLETLIEPIPGLENLSAPFTSEEIDDVVSKMPADKAPGPDGFNGQFLKSCWPTIKHDIYQL